MEITAVQVRIPGEANAIIGGCNFIKTAQDLYETLAESSPSIKFGLAFCEASGKRLVRSEGNDDGLRQAAEQTAKEIGAGHCFVIFLKNAFPVSVLNRIKAVSEVTTVYAATANPLQVLVAETPQGRGIVGVIDGETPLGMEGEADKRERRELMKKFGYKT
ncbi:MAG: adenosine-specific kinase [Candidatus Micrarchaeota archaeon]